MTPLTAQARYEYAWRRTHRPLRRFRREGTVRAYCLYYRKGDTLDTASIRDR